MRTCEGAEMKIIESDSRLALYQRYPSQSAPQSCYVQLDIDAGVLFDPLRPGVVYIPEVEDKVNNAVVFRYVD